MKIKLLVLALVSAWSLSGHAQTCSRCGGPVSASAGVPATGPTLYISMGGDVYGASAGHLVFANSLSVTNLCTPAALQFNAPTLTNVTTVFNTDGSLRQVNAPQALADIPVPGSTNGYVINFYYASQVGVQVDGTFSFSGAPFSIWLITNTSPGTTNTLQISRTSAAYGLVKQNTYTCSSNGMWTNLSLGGLTEEVQTASSPSANTSVFIDSIQSPSGPVVQQVDEIYQTFSWSACTNTALVERIVGTGEAAQITTNTYWDPATFGAGAMILLQSVVRPDGSWTYYNSYDTSGNPTDIHSSYGDVPLSQYQSAEETIYTYDPVAAGVSSSGDVGTNNPDIPRLVVRKVGNEVSRQYTVFPAVNIRLDIRCTVPGASWNDPENLFTTNYFYTAGPNQFLPQSVIYPDHTMTTYGYSVNAAGTYSTNIVVTGQPDSSFATVVDGVSNVTVLNADGYNVLSASYDVLTQLALSRDAYGNLDNWGRPQQVTHLDGTTEYAQYACCGLDLTTDRDGMMTQYFYDAARRPAGYEKIYSGTVIIYTNALDAAGRTVQTVRIGTDGSQMTLRGIQYDSAGEVLAETNALNGVTLRTRSNDPNTGGLVRIAIAPDGGALTNSYYLDGAMKESMGTSVYGITNVIGVEYDAVSGGYALYSQPTKLNMDGSISSEWTKTYENAVGKIDLTTYPDGASSQSFYNSLGQLATEIDPDGVTTLYGYNGKGEQISTTLDPNGSDRITYTLKDVTTDHSTTVWRTQTYVCATTGSGSNLVSVSEVSADGLTNWRSVYPDGITAVTTTNVTSPGSSRTVTAMRPDGSYTITLYSYGRLASVTKFDATPKQIGQTTFSYDAHGRQSTVTDARNGATSYTYNNADQVTSETTPSPGGVGYASQTTSTYYDTLMRPTTIVYADGTSLTNIYYPTGQLQSTYGSRTYPVAYSYDYAGRMQTMTTWTNFSTGTGAELTTWNYDPSRGFLISKVYADNNNGPTYGYKLSGRLLTRTWARGTTTTYSYTTAGDLASVSYDDNITPSVTYTYDRLGRKNTVVCGATTTTFIYDLANDVLSESYSGGPLDGLTVTNQFDPDLRRSNLALVNGSTGLYQAVYGYDAASRLASVSDGNKNSAAYSYLANSMLVSNITFAHGGATKMTTLKQYDYLNRLSSISSFPSNSFAYQYNAANQRTLDRLWDGNYWRYGYDALGEVVSGNKYWSDETPVAGQQFDYAFDTIGNRTQTKAGGDQIGANLRVANYANNALNQITNRDVPGYVDIMGDAVATNSVLVNSQTPYRKGEYFRQQVSVPNTSGAAWQAVTVASGQSSVTGSAYVAQTPESFTYDADGNLTRDGRWIYTWDGENRLINMISLGGAPSGSQLQLAFAYDYQGRRIQKLVSTNSISGYMGEYTNNYAYDGWNCIAILYPSMSLMNSFLWGSDLSGSLQGAGGVGGLLEMSYYGLGPTNCFVAYDGNGNVTALVNAANNNIPLANYEYGPFGELIRATGPMAKLNPAREGTKFYDDETDMVYYGYRYYNPSTGRWLSRDPVGEAGFKLVANRPKTDAERAAGRMERRLKLVRNPILAARIREQFRQKGLVASPMETANVFVFINNDPIDNYDMLGLLAPSPGTCVVATEAAATVAAGIATLPATAIVLGVVIVGEGVVITYEICHKPTCNPVTICHKTDDWWEEDPNDPESGERLCKYQCNDGTVHVDHGTACDNETITVPSW